jgi:16S rRNA (guanine527-N7)-methyltransferase
MATRLSEPALPSAEIAQLLNLKLAEASQPPVTLELALQFARYCTLLQKWNARTNLTAIRDADGILSRHFVECIACARLLPNDIRTLLDFGSGAGFPGIPVALCRPEVTVTLAESQGKKAAFLLEAIRTLGLNAHVHAGRAEMIDGDFECVTLRAVDKMHGAVTAASKLVRPGKWLALMTTEMAWVAQRGQFNTSWMYSDPTALVHGDARVLALVRREG